MHLNYSLLSEIKVTLFTYAHIYLIVLVFPALSHTKQEIITFHRMIISQYIHFESLSTNIVTLYVRKQFEIYINLNLRLTSLNKSQSTRTLHKFQITYPLTCKYICTSLCSNPSVWAAKPRLDY